MKTLTATTLLALVLAGCATSRPDRVDARGSYPDVGKGNAEGALNPGSLLVYSPVCIDRSSGRTITNGADEPAHVVHTGYTIYDSEGKLQEHVRNHSLLPSVDEPPDEIALAPGRYLIWLDAAGSHPGKFWVTVESQKETRVDVARLDMASNLETK